MDKKATKPYPVPDEDKELIRSFNAGSMRAFDSLVLKYKDQIFNLAVQDSGKHVQKQAVIAKIQTQQEDGPA